MNRFELIKFVKDRDTKVRQANNRERSPQTHQQTQREERTEIKTINYRKENLTLDTGQMIEKRIETKKKNKKIHRQKEERKKIIFFFRFHPFQISPFDRCFCVFSFFFLEPSDDMVRFQVRLYSLSLFFDITRTIDLDRLRNFSIHLRSY